MSVQLLECVPNFSEGCDMSIINAITAEISKIEGVKLLDVDAGKATNRTVVTFIGDPESVIEAAFYGIKKASELIDMNKHKGEHPRMGATDVCPLIPISHISMEETIDYAHKLAKRVGEELGIPIFMYESAATEPKRKNLATIRSGEYEAMAEKIQKPEWKPDYGSTQIHKQAGVTAIGARDFLIAYNINLNTTSTRRANSVAFDVREAGRVRREGDTLTGKVMKDDNGNTLRQPGLLKSVKAIGWYIDEYDIAQISMNLTDIKVTPLHIAFETVRSRANARGLRVTGSELVGLVPKKVMIDAGKYFLQKQKRSTGISEEEIIRIAIKSLGLDELGSFDPKKKIIEYQLEIDSRPLVEMSLQQFARETASESVAPGGGSVSAYLSALGVSLGTMVANLSAHKRGWDDKVEMFSQWAEKGQGILDRLLFLVDEDTHSFNKIISAVRMPKKTEEDKKKRHEAMQKATIYATEIPLQVMQVTYTAYELIEEMSKNGNPNSITDAGVGALSCLAGIEGAFLNVCVNAKDIEEKGTAQSLVSQGKEIVADARSKTKEINDNIFTKLGVTI